MANLKEIRTRIASVQSTRQITSAMKMVSAAKLRKAQDKIIQMRPYAGKLNEILTNLSRCIDDQIDTVFFKKRKVERVLIIAISSNKGLCGAYNANVAKKVIQLLETDYRTYYEQDRIDIISIGKKATELMKNKNVPITETHHDILDHLGYDLVKPLAKRMLFSFENGIYDEIKIVYNQFRNAAIQDLIVEDYLPVLSNEEEEPETEIHNHYDYIFEPSVNDIIRDLIPKSLKIQLYKAFLDSIASEHGARMTAMHKATDNASEMIKSLQLEYNKARQATITNEILEIVSGAEALKG